MQNLFPNALQMPEKTVAKPNGAMGMTIHLTAEESAEFERARELLSHAHPGASNGQIIARLAKEFNDRKDPLRRGRPLGHRNEPTPRPSTQSGVAATPQRDIARLSKRTVRAQLVQDANASCEFVDQATGRRCGSRFQLEIDHIVAKALGGADEPSNLRCLCRNHNQFMADKTFGRAFMEAKRRN
jgi:hypothetical protein